MGMGVKSIFWMTKYRLVASGCQDTDPLYFTPKFHTTKYGALQATFDFWYGSSHGLGGFTRTDLLTKDLNILGTQENKVWWTRTESDVVDATINSPQIYQR